MPPPHITWVDWEDPPDKNKCKESSGANESFWVLPSVNDQEHSYYCKNQCVEKQVGKPPAQELVPYRTKEENLKKTKKKPAQNLPQWFEYDCFNTLAKQWLYKLEKDYDEFGNDRSQKLKGILFYFVKNPDISEVCHYISIDDP